MRADNQNIGGKGIRVNKRYCPKCGEIMKVITTESTVMAKSRYPSDDLPVDRPIKNYQTLFYCQICRLKYTLEDLRKISLLNKKKDR